LASNGIGLPVLNVFRMFGLMGGQRLMVESSGAVDLDSIESRGVRDKPDVAAVASLQDGKLCVLIWHYHDDDVPGPAADVELSLKALPARPGPVLLEHFRIDRDHSNAYEVWKRLGSPPKPTPDQYNELERASQLALLSSPEWLHLRDGELTLRVRLPRHAVSLLVLSLGNK
jgi:xylan 1,4-beta-xylosidase